MSVSILARLSLLQVTPKAKRIPLGSILVASRWFVILWMLIQTRNEKKWNKQASRKVISVILSLPYVPELDYRQIQMKTGDLEQLDTLDVPIRSVFTSDQIIIAGWESN